MLRRGVVHHAQEVNPLLMPVPLLAQTDHFSIQSIERCEQRCCAIALVIVGHGAGPAALQRQAWLRAVESLTLTLLVATQHQGMLGWMEIQADDGLPFFGEVRIGGHFKRLHQMRLEPVVVPDAPHRGLAEADRSRPRSRGPMGPVSRLLLCCFLNHSLHLGGGNTGRAARPGRVLLPPRHPQSEEPLPPARCLLRRDSQLGGDILILFSGGRQHHDAGALDQSNGQRSRPSTLLQCNLLFSCQVDWQHASEEPLYFRDDLPGITIPICDALH